MTFNADKVREVAAAQLAPDPNAGGALCVLVDGEVVLDETWGLADADAKVPYTAQTLQMAQSMGKGVIGALAALLITRGQLDPKERVAAYWPEFGTPDKRDITVEQLLSHQTGLVYLDDGMPFKLTNDRARLMEALVAQSPAWEPGARVGYSPQTSGNYADVLFERASGSGVAGLLRELTDALRIEMYVGLPAELDDRAATVFFGTASAQLELPPEMAAAVADPDSLVSRVMGNVPEALADPIGAVNSAEGRRAFMPAATMFSSARAFAHLYGAMERTLAGAPSALWSREVLEDVTRERVRGVDAVNMSESAFALAFQKPNSTYPFARSPRAFGHGGSGGSFAMADPDSGVAMCWITTSYSTGYFDARQTAVLDAVYSALD